jgi:hypothetical protein
MCSTCTCSSCVRSLGISFRRWPRVHRHGCPRVDCRRCSQDRLHREGARGRTATVKASTRSSVTNCSTVKSFARGRVIIENWRRHYNTNRPPLCAQLPTAGTGGLHARASGSAIGPSRSARAHAGSAPNPKLTSPPDPSGRPNSPFTTGRLQASLKGRHGACDVTSGDAHPAAEALLIGLLRRQRAFDGPFEVALG